MKDRVWGNDLFQDVVVAQLKQPSTTRTHTHTDTHMNVNIVTDRDIQAIVGCLGLRWADSWAGNHTDILSDTESRNTFSFKNTTLQ